jgi:3-oxoacyl-[acyl-carrier-protein] synthase-1
VKPLAVVVGVGAYTPIGMTARDTGFLLRTGASGLTEGGLVDSNEEPVIMCVVPTLDPRLVGPGRALRLAMPAMEEALAAVGDVAASLKIKLVLAVDEHIAEKRADGVIPASILVAMLHQRAKEIAPGTSVEVCARGPAGPGFVLAALLASLSSGQVDAVLLGGMHSDYDPAVIAQLEEKGRLYTSQNKDALIPGEAAAFALLMRPDVARRHGLTAYAQIHSVATGWEKATPDNDHPRYEAIGMTVSVKKAGAPLVEEKLCAGWVLSDMSFEMRRLYEWQAINIRARKLFGPPHYFDAPAQRMGYLGASVIPMHLALASVAWRHGYAPSPIAMSVSGSDPGERAAILVSDAAS